MKLKLCVAISAFIASGVAVADSYKSELDASVTRIHVMGENYDSYKLGGTYYFNDVNTAGVPLAEAAFLGKNSSVFANAWESPSQHGSSKSNAYSLGASVYVPEDFLYVSAGVSRSKSAWSSTDDDWYTAVGVTPIDGLLISTYYTHDAGYDANINAKYVTAIGDGQFINLEAAVIDYDDGTFASLGGDYYFDNTLSVGGEITNIKSYTDYTVRARKFFTEQLSANVSYTDSNDRDGNVLSVGAAIRF